MPYLRKLLQFLPFVSLLLFSLSLSGQSVLINEISATNTLLTDEDEKTNDWFELYNASSQPVDLADWGLSDDREAPAKWALPQISLPPGAYLLVWASGKDRPRLAEPRTLITQGDIFRYHLPDAPFLSNWRDLDFDDAVWSTGPSGFGHGDGDDTTEVPPGTLTVQLRKKFTLTAPEDITDMVLSMDIDDGFVAYLNGQEVARDNIRGSRPNYNTRADHDWEANMYSGRSPKDYELLNFRELLRVGENILAIQVHNANITSNDLTAIPYLTAFYRSASNEGIPTPAVLQLDKRNPHTNFKLSGQGETLYLTNAGGSLVDSLAFPAMPTNTSFGRTATGDYAFFAAPTPEARNDTPPATNSNTPHLRFSSPDGPVPATGIDLIISGSLSGESVRYTLDATEPTVASPLYSGPIHIDTATVVRARIFRDNYLPSPVQSRTFLPGADHDLPVVTMVTEPANYFDAQTGIYVLGEGYNGSSPFFGSNIWQDWERPLHFTLHPENGEPAYRFDGGVKIFGGWSRALAQRSLSVFARSAYGSDAIDYPLFTSRPYDSYQAFVLRNSGNDWLQTMLRDAALTGLLADANLETQAYRPTAAYLNGQYWGIYNLREKVNEHFLAAKFDLDPDEINILEFGGDLIHGSTAGYPEFIQFLRQNEANVLSAQQYDYVKSLIDVDNYILYILTQVYFGNHDWPTGNVKYWRPNNGKWRWILFDTDNSFGFGNPEGARFNSLRRAITATSNGWPNQYWANRILRDLLNVTEFRHQFINNFADALNRRFLSERVKEHIDTLAQAIATEIPTHFARWNSDSDAWEEKVDLMKSYATQRPPFIKQHLLAEFELPAFHPVTITNDHPERGFVFVNRLDVRNAQWTGDYFETVPVKFRAIPTNGYQFSHWEIDSESTEANIQIDPTKALTLRPVFSESDGQTSNVVINEINYNSLDEADAGDWVELHNPSSSPIDLSGWDLKDDDDTHEFLFPEGTILDAKSFLIVTRKPNDFATIFPNVDNTIGNLNFGFAGSGDQVRLYDRDGDLVDSVAYEDKAPWPTAADGDGATLELLSPELDNTLAINWGTRNPDGGSPGRQNWPTSLAPSTGAINFSSYPNPTNGELTLSFNLGTLHYLTANLYRSDGALITTLFSSPFLAGQRSLTLELPGIPRGLYLLQLVDEEGKSGAIRIVKR